MPNTNVTQSSAPSLFSHESVETAVITAVGNAFEALEPKIQQYATQVAHQAVEKSQDLAERTYRRVQRQPMLLLGFAALALAGVAASMIMSNKNTVQRITH